MIIVFICDAGFQVVGRPTAPDEEEQDLPHGKPVTAPTRCRQLFRR
jgi:hypothetical protein